MTPHVVLDEADEMLSMGFEGGAHFGECPAGKAKGMGGGGGAPPDDTFDLDELLGEEAPPAPVADHRPQRCSSPPRRRAGSRDD